MRHPLLCSSSPMGLRYDCAASVLLCTEDNRSILGLDDDNNGEGAGERSVDGELRMPGLRLVAAERRDLSGDPSVPLPPLQSEDCIRLLLEKEQQYLPREDYAERLLNGSIDLTQRTDAIDWIEKVHSRYNYGPLTAYLSVNYLDRFLSANELQKGKTWMIQLLSVTCLSLAAKVEETEVPSSLDLQVENAKYIFESRTIRRMELLVLGALEWRMQAITPLTFIQYFLHKFGKETSPDFSSVRRTLELILGTTKGTEFLAFRQSEIAAAAALLTLKDNQAVEIHEALIHCPCVEKERVLRCYDTIKNMALMKKKTCMNSILSASAAVRSPIEVLDVACASYKSDDKTVGSQANPHQTSPIAKKRKLESMS